MLLLIFFQRFSRLKSIQTCTEHLNEKPLAGIFFSGSVLTSSPTLLIRVKVLQIVVSNDVSNFTIIIQLPCLMYPFLYLPVKLCSAFVDSLYDQNFILETCILIKSNFTHAVNFLNLA